MTSTLDIERPAPEYEHAPTTSCCAPTALLEASDEISELWARPWATSPRSSARCVRWCAASHATGGCVGTGGSTRTAVDYELNRLKNDGDERFRRAYAARRVTLRDHEDGTGTLTIGSSIDQVQLAEHRLTLAAKAMRSGGDERTLHQLRADLAIDLILGRRQVTADEERADPGTGLAVSQSAPLPRFARPIINLTVPIQTVMGLADEPGVLSGGTPVPASLARMMAQQPGSTWYRMLTDPAGRFLELSTRSYQPTAPIWRDVVARYNSCYRANCTRPATQAELDHRTPYPDGATDTANLQPGCTADHRIKHAPGFRVEQADDGALILRTAAGFTHRTEPVEHPASDEWPDDDASEIQFSPTELAEALEQIRLHRQWDTPIRRDLLVEEAVVAGSR